MKATHSGECQICGRVQKLPSNRLANHGYTVQWGFFSGVCTGSGHLPFEVSCALIAAAVTRAADRATELEARIVAIRARTDCNGFYNDYVNNAYQWREVAFTQAPSPHNPEYMLVSFQAADGVPFKFPKVASSSGFYTHGIDNIARESRERYCKSFLQKQADQLRSYVAWQNARLANWAPKTLKPV